MKKKPSQNAEAAARLEKYMRMHPPTGAEGDAGTADWTITHSLQVYFKKVHDKAVERGQGGGNHDKDVIFRALDRYARSDEFELPKCAQYLKDHYDYGNTQAFALAAEWKEARGLK